MNSSPSTLRLPDASAPWVEGIPGRWKQSEFRWLLTRNDSGVWGDDPLPGEGSIVLRSTDQTVDGKWRVGEPALRALSSSEQVSARLIEGDLVVTKSSGSSNHIGKTTIVDAEIEGLGACFSNFMQRVRCSRGLRPRFAYYFLNSKLGRQQLDFLSGTTTGLANLNGRIIARLLLLVPGVEEQDGVVRFLDRKTSEIDTLVAKKERLVELLQQKRSALIARAVTKGLDPSAPMKDSGIPWLGELPAHWKIARMGDVFRAISGGTPDRSVDRYWGGDIPWVSPKDMKRPEIAGAEESISGAALRECGLKLIAPGAVLVVVRGMILAHSFPVAVTSVPVTINQDMKALVVPSSISCRFAALWLQGTATVIRGLTVEDAAHGTKAIRQDTWRTLPFPILPIEEQNAIVSSVEEQKAQIDALSGKVSEAIDRLREYRTALISAAVTGKIDVRGVARDALSR